jgi:farnesyl diphosphate synthase
MQSMDYNVPGGKLNRGLSVVDSVAILKGRELTETEYFKAAVLGWAVEWVRIFVSLLPSMASAS